MNAQSQQGITPLHLAAWQQSAEIVALLLAHRAQVDCADQYGHTPLSLASSQEGVTVEGWGTAAAVDFSITQALQERNAEKNS